MKTKSCLGAILAFLLFSVAAMAAEREEAISGAVAAESEVLAEPVALASTPEDCGAGDVSERFAPPSVELASSNDVCGACSHRLCQGREVGSWCGIDKWCIPVLHGVCSPGFPFDWNCQCASDYL